MAVKGEDRIIRRSVLRSRWRERGEEKRENKTKAAIVWSGDIWRLSGPRARTAAYLCFIAPQREKPGTNRACQVVQKYYPSLTLHICSGTGWWGFRI